MAFKDMREYLALLEEHGQLKHVDAPINCEYENNELQSLMRHLAETSGPGLVLKNLEGYNTLTCRSSTTPSARVSAPQWCWASAIR